MSQLTDLRAIYAAARFDGLALDARLASGAAVIVMFDQAAQNVLGMVGTNPIARAVAADVPVAAVDAAITIDGTAFTIRRRDPIDDGLEVELQLQAA